MRKLSSIAIAVAAAAAFCPAQVCPLGQPLTSPNNGNVGGGLYFNLNVTTTVRWDRITYVAADTSATGNSSFNMFVGPSTYTLNVGANPGPWVLVGASAPVPIVGGVDNVVVGVINPAGLNTELPVFAPGNYGIALQAVGHSWGYQNGALTLPAPGGEFTVTAGGASNAFLALPTFVPRSINGRIDYTVTGTPTPFAQREPYGEGCYRNFMSFYELMPNTATNQDLSNTSMYMTLDAGNNRYAAILPGTTPINLAAVVSPSLGHTDNSTVIVNLEPIASPLPIQFPNIGGLGTAAATVVMDSNMLVNLLGTAASTAAVTTATFLGGTAVRVGNWHNINPAVGGTTHYDFDAINGVHLFTWLAVPDFGGAGSNNFQLAFFPNGDVEFRWGAMSLLGGGGLPTLVGFSPGATSADPGTVDLSVRLTQLPVLSTAGFDRPPLTLTANLNPVLGTTLNLTTSNATGVSLGFCFIGVADLPPFSPVGFNLAPLNAAGCFANVSVSPSISPQIDNFAPANLVVPFAIPAGPVSIIGESFYCQSIWLDPLGQNTFLFPLGLLTSNALRLKIGAF